MQIVVGIITVSDRASAGDYKDLGGPALKEVAQENEWQVLCEAVIPDDATKIQETVRSFSKQGCGLILTTGGTGIGPRDVTPEAIRAIMRVELPALGEPAPTWLAIFQSGNVSNCINCFPCSVRWA